MNHSSDLDILLINYEFRLESTISDPTDPRQPISSWAFKHNPVTHVRGAVPAHEAGSVIDNESRLGLRRRVPFLAEPTVALHEVVGAKSCAPAYVVTGWALGAEFAQDGDLAVAEEGVAVWEDAV